MDARRLTFGFCCVLLSQGLGCASPLKSLDNPFDSKAKAADAAQAGGADADPAQRGTSITQAGYSVDTAEGAPPGVSIDDDTAVAKPSLWERTVGALDPDNIKKSYKKAIGKAPNEAVAKQLYTEADELFRQKKYKEAAEKFVEAAGRWPDSLLEEDALYMAGESYFFDDRYYDARSQFDELIKKYENSRHLDRVTARQFAIGRFWETKGNEHHMLALNMTDKTRPWFDTHGNGIKCYETIRLSDPTGPLADDALMAQSTAYFLDNRFEDASYHYELLRKDYTSSEHQKQAHLLGLQSYLNAYQGPQYDVTPLKKAETLADQTLKNYGHEMPEEKPRLHQAKDAIRAQQAEREYELGEYYRRLDYNRAARNHYAIVLKDFPDTKFADLAKQRMQETESLPPEPIDHFPWLTNWLGNRDARNRVN